MKKFLFGALFLLMLGIPMSVWAQVTTPYFEDFESMTASTVPTGWTNSGTTSSMQDNPQYVWGVYAYGGNQMIRMYNYLVQNGTAMINMPAIILPSTGTCQMAFKYAHNASCGDFKVKISTDGGTTFTDLATYSKGAGSSYSDPGTFTEETIDLSSYLGNTVTIQFWTTANYGNGAIFVDDVEVGPVPTCFPPTGLTVSNVTATAADFSWTASGLGESQYQCLCIPADSTPDWTNVSPISSTMEFASDLQANTSYRVYVRSYCGATDQSKVVSTSFRTSCAIISAASLPYVEDFEDYVGGGAGVSTPTPYCWDVYSTCASGAVLPHVAGGAYTAYPHSGNNSLLFYGKANAMEYATLPEFANPLNTLQISFWAGMENASCGTMVLGYITSDDVDFNTFTAIDTIPYYSRSSMGFYEKSLSALSSDAYRLVILWNYVSSSSYFSGYVDDITVDAIPTCPKPTDLDVIDSTLTTTSAEVTWTAGSSETAWNIRYKLVADTAWTLINNVATNPYTITGLTQASNYEYQVQAVCVAGQDSSRWTSSFAFSTGCDVITTFPWTENFDNEPVGDFAKVCWTNEHISGSGTKLAKIKTSTMGDNETRKLSFDYQTAGTWTRVLTPEFNIPTADAYEFTLDVYRQDRTYDLDDAVRVVIDNGAGKDTIVIPAVISVAGSVGTVSETGWYNYAISLPHAGIQKIEILDINYYGSSTYMDNFRVRKTPACVKVMDVAVRDYQTTQATIEWTMTAAPKYQVLFTTVKVDPDTLATVPASVIAYNDSTASAIDSMVVTGLNPATKYFVYVRGLCSDEIGEWSTVINFRTECAPITISKTNIYTNGFEDETSLSKDILCWELNTTASGSQWPAAYNYAYYAHSGNMLLYFGGYAGSNDTSYYTMVETTNPVTALRLRFWMNGTNSVLSQNDSIYIGVMADINDKSSFVPVAGYQVNNSGYNQYEVCFDEYQGPDGRIAIKRVPVAGVGYMGGAAYYGSCIDDISIDLAPTCKKVENIAAKNVTSQGATITWTGKNASLYHVTVADASINPAEADSATLSHVVFNDSVATDSVVVTGLNSLTNYYVYVMANCGAGDYSDYSSEYSFLTATTLPYVQRINGNVRPAEMSWYVASLYGMDSVLAGVDNLRALEATSSSWYMSSYIGGDTTTLKINMYCTTNGGFATPTLEFNGAENTTLSFDVCKRAYNSSNTASDDDNTDDYFYVILADPTMTQFTVLASWGNDTEGMRDFSLRNDIGKDFTHMNIDMSEYQGTYRVLFYAGSYNCNDDYDLHIDNIKLGVPATVTALANDTARGTVTGSCETVVGAKVPLIAYPNEGFHLLSWSDGVTSNFNIYTAATTNDTVVATFVPDSIAINATSLDPTMGTVTGSGNYYYGDTAVITAVPETGYHFVAWSDNDSNAVRAFVATEEVNITAEFAINTYNVTFNVNDTAAGYLTGDITGVYNYGSVLSVTAVANEDYEFAMWSNGDTAATITYTVTDDATFTALFFAISTDTFYVAALANDTVMGTVAGAGYYRANRTATLTATANVGYHFVDWSNGENTETINVLVLSDTTLTANFAINTYDVDAYVNDPVMGDVVGAGRYNYNQTATLVAVPNHGYEFTGWSNGELSDTLTIVVTEDTAVTAYFAILSYDVVVVPNDTAKGTVSGSGEYEFGSQVVVSAIANEGYHFINWSNGVTTESFTLVVDGDTTVVANFAADGMFYVTVVADGQGTVTGEGEYALGDTATLVATPNDGYRFIGWSNGEFDYSINVVVESDTTLTAYFEAIPLYNVTVNIEGDGMVKGIGVYREGTAVTLVAVPDDGNKFKGWSNGEKSDTLVFYVISDTLFTATFEAITAVEDVEATEYVAYTEGHRINVVGAENHTVSVFDATGRMIAIVEKANRDEHFTVAVPGVYFIRVYGMKSTAVVVK